MNQGGKFSDLSLSGVVQLGVAGLKELERQKRNSEAAPSNFGYLEISRQLLLLQENKLMPNTHTCF